MADDDERASEWDKAAEDAKTTLDGVPLPIADATTPRPETTGRHRLTPAQFASGVELAERDGYQRGFEHGQAAARAQAEADAVTELRRVREDCLDTIRALFVIWEIGHPTWEEAERWIRSRLTPL